MKIEAIWNIFIIRVELREEIREENYESIYY